MLTEAVARIYASIWRIMLLPLCRCLLLLAVLSPLTACSRGSHSLTVDGQCRTFELHVPANLAADSLAPLLIALHPFTLTGKKFAALTGFSDLADEEQFIVVYPDGMRRTWNTAEEGIDDLGFLEALIDHLLRTQLVDSQRIYVTGASAGGMMAQFLACRSQRIAAASEVMGSMETRVAERCGPGPSVPMLLIHGDADPIVPYEGGEVFAGPGRRPVFLSADENAAWWAARNGCDATPERTWLPEIAPEDGTRVERIAFGGCEDMPVVLLRIEGGGHTWPGQEQRWPRRIVGRVSREMDASRTVWHFLETVVPSPR